jgi:hypothetical protein
LVDGRLGSDGVSVTVCMLCMGSDLCSVPEWLCWEVGMAWDIDQPSSHNGCGESFAYRAYSP